MAGSPAEPDAGTEEPRPRGEPTKPGERGKGAASTGASRFGVRGKWIAMGIALVVLISPFSVAGLLRWLTFGARNAATTFMDRLRAGDAQGAADLVSQRLRSELPAGGITAYVDDHAPVLQLATKTEIEEAQGSRTWVCVRVSLVGVPAERRKLYFIVVQEDSQWRIDSLAPKKPSGCETD